MTTATSTRNRILLLLLLSLVLDITFGTFSMTDRLDPIFTPAVLISMAISAAAAGAQYLVAKFSKKKPGEVNRQDIRLTTATEGAPIPRIYGTFAVSAKIIARGSVTERVVSNSGGKRQAPNFERRYSCSLAAVVCENFGNILGVSRIWYNGNVLYQRDPSTLTGANPPVEGDPTGFQAPHIQQYGYGQAFQILLGREDQTERCSWFSALGPDTAPGYRGYVTLWWRDMDLTPAYNQIPQILVEVVCSDDTIADCYARECELAGLTPAQINNGAPLDGPLGWFADGPTAPKQIFEMLDMWHPFSVAEVDGQLKSFPVPTTSSATIEDGELGAVTSGREEEREKSVKFAMTTEQPIELPQRIEVTYFDAARTYEQASAGYARQFGVATGVQQIFVPFSTTKVGAQFIASQMLARMWTERDLLSVTLPPKYIKFHPGDTLTLPAPDTTAMDLRINAMEFAPGDVVKVDGVQLTTPAFLDMRIASMEISPGEVVKVDAIRQVRFQGLGKVPGDLDIPPPDPTTNSTYIQSAYVISNCPPLIDDHDAFDGIYWGACPSVPASGNPLSQWQGALLYRNACGSDDTDKVYEEMASALTAAVIGKAKTVLAAGTGVDTVNTVDIEFPFGAGSNTILGTLDRAFTFSQTANLAILGNEVIQFRDVDDVSDLYGFAENSGRVYRLMGKLKRGLKDTAAQTTTHVIDEAFMLWNPYAVIRVPVNINEHVQLHNYKSITRGMSEPQIANPSTIHANPDVPFNIVNAHVSP